jgi:aminobenzoyl-glutamate utilization protein B
MSIESTGVRHRAIRQTVILSWCLCLWSCALNSRSLAQETDRSKWFANSDRWLSEHATELTSINRHLWSHPEVGLQEHKAAERLTRFLEESGFKIERGVAGMPTAFVAEKGRGHPVIAILAEYDALPGMSQAAVPDRRAREDGNDAGHACGHSLFGTASTGAAVAAAIVASQAGLPGTIRLYGTPAEETLIGKVYMTQAGLFKDVDAVLHWHPGDRTSASYASSKALISIKFRFQGLGAHSSVSPHAGRSALDAVELMNIGANFLREHIKEESRIHYVITDGGGQPNVVPAKAEVWYYLRADSHSYVEYILKRVREIARGAALMSATEVEEQIDTDCFEVLPSLPLSQLLQRHLKRVGPPLFNSDEVAFARKTQLESKEDKGLATGIEAFATEPTLSPGSTDVGNVSWVVPTGGMRVACYTYGAPSHSWQIVACAGTSIGEKGMMVAAKTLASATLELLTSPSVLTEAKKDFQARLSKAQRPVSVLPATQNAPKSIR